MARLPGPYMPSPAGTSRLPAFAPERQRKTPHPAFAAAGTSAGPTETRTPAAALDPSRSSRVRPAEPSTSRARRSAATPIPVRADPVIGRGGPVDSSTGSVSNPVRQAMREPRCSNPCTTTPASAHSPLRLCFAAGSRYRSPTSRLNADFVWTGWRPLEVSHLPHLGCLSCSGYAWPPSATPCPPVAPCML